MNKVFRLQRLHVFTDDEGTALIAFDPGDAIKAWEEWTGDKWDETYAPFTVQISDRAIIPIHSESDDFDDFKKHRPPFSKIGMGKIFPFVSAPAWLWCLWNGRGFLYSSEF
jgi:hypothetical protein